MPGQVAGWLRPLTTLELDEAAFVVHGTEVSAWFGISTAVFDADGDGHADVYAGAPNEEEGQGAVYLFDGAALVGL